MAMRICITGASGMVGQHLLAEASTRRYAGVCTSRHVPKSVPNGFTWVSLDLASLADASKTQADIQLETALSGIDAIIHAGAYVPTAGSEQDIAQAQAINVRAVEKMCDFAQKKNIIFVQISGAIVYAQNLPGLIDESAPKTDGSLGGAYALSKLHAEQIIEAHKEKGLRAIILRPSSIYGRGQSETQLVPRLLRSLQENERIELMPPVEDSVNLVHASDVARGAFEALEKNTFDTFNIASLKQTTMRELADLCVEALGKGTVLELEAQSERQPTQRYNLSTEKAAKMLGFVPKMSLRDGLKRILEEI